MLEVLKQVTASMTAPDQMFAISEAEVRGHQLKVWAKALCSCGISGWVLSSTVIKIIWPINREPDLQPGP